MQEENDETKSARHEQRWQPTCTTTIRTITVDNTTESDKKEKSTDYNG